MMELGRKKDGQFGTFAKSKKCSILNSSPEPANDTVTIFLAPPPNAKKASEGFSFWPFSLYLPF